MPGLFDFLNDPQTAGLLGGAGAILNASGPSLVPRSFGQVLGAGLDGMQQAQAQQMQMAQAQQLAKLNGLKIQDAESDLKKQEAERQRAEALRKFYMGDGPGQAVPMPAPQSANSLFQGALAGAPAQPEAAPAALGAQGGNQNSGIYQQRMGMAERLRRAGFATEADAQEAAALKFQPKVKGWERVQQGGRVMFAPFFEDGTSGQPVPLDVAEKLEKVNRGGTTDLVNPYTGAGVASLTNTVSPDAVLSSNTTMRGQNMIDARSRELNAITAGTKAPTEFQGKSAAFGLRATEADKILNELSGKYSPAAINSKQAVEGVWGLGGMMGAATNKFALNANDQRAEQAQRDFINAVLRQESGAAIGAQEFDNAKKQYFPQPGDGPEVIAQKANNRQLAIQGFNNSSGRAMMTARPKPAAGGWSITKVD